MMSLQIEFKYNYNYELMVYTKAYSYMKSYIEMKSKFTIIYFITVGLCLLIKGLFCLYYGQ